MKVLLWAAVFLQTPILVLAQFDFSFEHMFESATGGGRGDHTQGSPMWYEQNYENVQCNDYVCQDTLACVKKPVDCPCVFPDSEEKCVLPDKKSYICISKVGRGCSFVEKAWKGLV